MLMLGTQSRYDTASMKWCLDASADFIQGIQLPGNVIISPIEVTSSPLTERDLQSRFYSAKPKFSLRQGPQVSDMERMTATIPYERSTYSYHMSLVAPPILLQICVGETDTCTNSP